MPVIIATRLNWSRTASPISACATRKTNACRTLTWPAGIGRDLVLSTLASRSRSVMSFQVQPAPRMTKAPTKNRATMRGNGPISWATPAARAADHQHGNSNSQEPIGRSRRESRRYGRDHRGARVSTQLPMASATRVPASLMCSGSSGEDVAVQGIERAAALFGHRRFGKRRRRTQHFAEARARRSSLLGLLCRRTHLFLHFLGVLVAAFELVGDLRRNPAFCGIGFDISDHLDLGVAE